MAVSSASFFGTLRTQIGASVRFSSTVRCGNRLNCWNTMPTSRRIASMFLRFAVSSMPSTMIWPFWCSSSRLMQRIAVDLPEPDGPQTTTRSPFLTVRLTFFSTWNSPYHLLTSRISMIGAPSFGAMAASDIPLKLLAALAFVETDFQPLAVSRHGEASDEIDRTEENVGFAGQTAPIRIDQRHLGRVHQVEQADDRDQRGVLEIADQIADQGRDRKSTRLNSSH